MIFLPYFSSLSFWNFLFIYLASYTDPLIFFYYLFPTSVFSLLFGKFYQLCFPNLCQIFDCYIYLVSRSHLSASFLMHPVLFPWKQYLLSSEDINDTSPRFSLALCIVSFIWIPYFACFFLETFHKALKSCVCQLASFISALLGWAISWKDIVFSTSKFSGQLAQKKILMSCLSYINLAAWFLQSKWNQLDEVITIQCLDPQGTLCC